jgi:dethiobiotin synthetase
MFGESHIPADAFKLPTQCVVEEKLGCINGTLPGATALAANGKRFQGMFKALE